MATTYWISTPTFTVYATVDAQNLIISTAPYTRRRWIGQPWADIQHALRQRYGKSIRIAVLAEFAAKETP
jgi:Zn-finger domain-containing protein